jgi:EAL domain-containing protein (putative c-di-GMP-specific phosphodiesterase class I)
MQLWSLAVADLVLALAGVLSWCLVHWGRLNAALIVSQLAFLAIAIGFCLLFDVPDGAVPRVSHLYLLALAMLGYLNYLRKPSVLQLAVIALCLAAFIAFASANLAFPFAQPISDELRIAGSWVNVTLAVAMLCGCVHVMQLKFTQSTDMARDLQSALRNREFMIYYQPQVDRMGRVRGAEALLRWKSPKRGFVSPADFICVAEEAGLMTVIGGWVLGEACRTLAEWQRDPATRDLTLSVNVSASQFHEQGFEQAVFREIATHQIDATRLKLELTESVMVADVEAVIGKMHVLRNAGVAIALDDFGTGYSSLDYLSRLPLNQLKMDRSFILHVVENKRSASLARNILQLGRDLELDVLAEGVETEEQFQFLLDHGCHEFQGFLFGRPVPRDDFDRRAAA